MPNVSQLTVPSLSLAPSTGEYFWYHLPVALPGFFSFVFCVFFAYAGFHAWWRARNNYYMLYFTLMALGMGALGLVLALRAVVDDLPLLLTLHKIFYPIALLLTGGAMGFNYYLMGKRYRVIRYTEWTLWGTIVLGSIALITGHGFTGQWNHFWFGHYPVGSHYLAPWGVLGVAGLVFVLIPAMVFYRKTGTNLFRDPIGIGVILTCIAIALNLPSLVGIPFFPGAAFMFLPMALIAYGVFKKDFFSLNELLFEKRLLYHITAFIISALLLGIALFLMLFVAPTIISPMYSNPLTAVPLFSGMIVFALAIYLAGSNPQSRVHMLGAMSMTLTGFFTILLTLESLRTPLLVNRRLEQLIYFVFAFTPMVQYRFAFVLLRIEPNWKSHIIDALSVAAAALALTPYFVSDFYEYYGGLFRIGKASLGLTLLSLTGFYSLCLIGYEWYIRRRESERGENIIVWGLIAGAVLMLANAPGAHGIFFPPLGALQFIPAIMIAYGILGHRTLAVRGEAMRIANRFQIMVLVAGSFLVFVYSRTLPSSIEAVKVWNHLSLIGASLVLGMSMLLFVLVRPVAALMDDSYHLLDAQKSRLEESTRGLREISEVSRAVYASQNLNGIIDIMFKYLTERFKIQGLWLLFVDTEKNRIHHVRHNAVEALGRETLAFLESTDIDLTPEAGMLYRTWKRKRTFYANRAITRGELAAFDKELIERVKLRAGVHIPLILQNEVIGVLLGMDFGDGLKLSKKDLQAIELFMGQVAGAVYSAGLLREISIQKKKSDELLLNILPRGIAEQLKEKGEVEPQYYDSVTILFTDFVGFTRSALSIAPRVLIEQLNRIFFQFDAIARHYGLEKIKTIGDSYMAAGGLPRTNTSHYFDVCLAALEIKKLTDQLIALSGGTDEPIWEIRIGIHTGPVMAGVVGQYKFVYDIFGDAVNVASRMESTSEAGRINISADTYEHVKYFFDCEKRGRIKVKNRGEVDMYFLDGLKPQYTAQGITPNIKFRDIYTKIKKGARIEPKKA